MRRTLQVMMMAATLTGLTAGLASADAKDAWLTAKTKIALMTADDLHTSSLNVDTVNGVVTLHGRVPTEAEKNRAEDVAERIDGVKSVKNLLQVVPSSQEDAVEASDDAIKESVERAFEANPAIKKSDIKVSSVNKGVVLISGDADNIVTHLEAIEAAYKVKGVRRVSSEVTVKERS